MRRDLGRTPTVGKHRRKTWTTEGTEVYRKDASHAKKDIERLIFN